MTTKGIDLWKGMDLWKIPIVYNPSGAPPNFKNGPSLEPAYMGVGITLVTISTFLVLVRIIANKKNHGKLRLDDYLCIVGWVTAVAYWAVLGSMIAAGVGRHAWDVPIGVFFDPSYVKRLLAQQILLYFSLFMVKAGILTLFTRIFDSVRWIRITAWSLITFLAGWHLTMIVIWILVSVPHGRSHWGAQSVAAATSKNVERLVVYNGIQSVVIDSIIFAIPFPSILSLHMRTRKKIGMIVVFAVALCSVAAAATGLAYRVLAYKGARGDPTWVAIKISITSVGELFGGLIVSCAPGAAAFWHRVIVPSKLYIWTYTKISGQPPDTPSQLGQDDMSIRYSFQSDLKRLQRQNSDLSTTSTPARSLKSPDTGYYDEKEFEDSTNFITSAIPEAAPIATAPEAKRYYSYYRNDNIV